jgi:ABC-type glycerol-3-phosphate transport system substrate-binding protein
MKRSTLISRRTALRLGAATGALPLVHVRTAGAAGRLAVAFWDHWVPDGNKVMQKQVDAWAARNKVDVTVDFVTVNNNKLLMTGVAESQAHAGHDIFTFLNWEVFNRRDDLAPVDDVMGRLTKSYGEVDASAAYLARPKDHWIAVPTSSGSQTKPACARIGWMKAHGFDPVAVYPVKPEHTPMQDQWTYDALLKLAEEALKDNMTFALGCGGPVNTDGTDQIGASFSAFGSQLVDRQGKMQLDTPEMQQCLEYWRKYTKFMPSEAQSFDDASNNRALISGKSALIFNPPSAWAVARRDAPQVAADCWTFPPPTGPKGRFVPAQFWFWGVWSFSKNQSAAKELLEYLSQREQVEERDNVVFGYDIPPFLSMRDFTIWEKVEPPLGTVYNYPVRPWHHAQSNLAASEAAPEVAVQIYQNGIHNGIIARIKEGQSIKQVLSWARNQIEGFLI